MISISGVCMLSVPVVVLIITLRKETGHDTGNKALFTPQGPIRSEVDQLLPSTAVRNSGHIQARYSTDED